MITRDLQIAIVVLLAGLTTGYFASNGAAKFHDRVVLELLDPSVEGTDAVRVRLENYYRQFYMHYLELLK